MTNYRSDRQTNLDIFVNNISVASKLYEVKPLIKFDEKSYQENERSQIGHSIGPREQVTMHYLISPIVPTDSTCLVTKCSLGNQVCGEDMESKATDFICLEYAHDKFKVIITFPNFILSMI